MRGSSYSPAALIHRIPNRDHQGVVLAERAKRSDVDPLWRERVMRRVAERQEHRPGDRVVVRVDRPALVVGRVG